MKRVILHPAFLGAILAVLSVSAVIVATPMPDDGTTHAWPPKSVLFIGDSWAYLCPVNAPKLAFPGCTIQEITKSILDRPETIMDFDAVIVYAGVAHRGRTGSSIEQTEAIIQRKLIPVIKRFYHPDHIFVGELPYMYELLETPENVSTPGHLSPAGYKLLLSQLPFSPPLK